LILFLGFNYINNEFGIAVLVGYFSHLFMDALTKHGISPLAPLVNRKINGPFKTNSLLGRVLFLVIVLLILYLLLLCS
jgi:membrane-bound metal-dependent hydrolase YbcI (DUF457 family)